MEEINLLNNAFRIYNLNDTLDLSERVLKYILSRIIANKTYIQQMIDISGTEISFNDIYNAFDEAYKENDFYKSTSSYNQGADYYSGVFPVPTGNIVVETNDVLQVIKYFVGGIKSRNTITISQTEYNELSLSSMMLIIFTEALAKFNISRNTLMIMPYEECSYDDFDEIIELEEKEQEKVIQKEFSKKYVIYDYDGKFTSEIDSEMKRLNEKNIDFEKIEGKFGDVLDRLNKMKPKGVSIYTSDPNVAYEFITLVTSPNVFVNSSLLNCEELNDKTNKFYYKKKIMYPSEKELNVAEYYKNYTDNIKEIKTDIFAKEDDKLPEQNNVSNNEQALVEVVNPWYKRILEKIKSFFKK